MLRGRTKRNENAGHDFGKTLRIKKSKCFAGKKQDFLFTVSVLIILYTVIFEELCKTAIDLNLVLPLPILTAYRKQANRTIGRILYHSPRFIPHSVVHSPCFILTRPD